MGDVGVSIEGFLIQTGDDLDVDVLKLGHHGSKTSSSEIFLNATTPEISVASAGFENRYHHPSSEVVDRLEFLDIPLLCTCEKGTILMKSDGETIQVKTKK